jgi:hypothetical protein
MEFKTKAELTAYCRRIRETTPTDQPITGEIHDFLLALLERHPEAAKKIGCGVAHFEVRVNNHVAPSLGMWLVRTDGSETDWSPRECISPTSRRSKVLSACRNAVMHQIRDFQRVQREKFGLYMKCPITGESVMTGLAHVDHALPKTFERLVEMFLDGEGLAFSTVELSSEEDGVFCDRFADPDLELRWRRYHYQNAELRLVSAKANLSVLRKQA